MILFTDFFKSSVSVIFLEFLVSQFHRVWRKYEISEENGRLFFRIFEKSELSLWILISYSVIFGDNPELSDEIWKISHNISENWKLRKSKIIPEKFWEIFPPGLPNYRKHGASMLNVYNEHRVCGRDDGQYWSNGDDRVKKQVIVICIQIKAIIVHWKWKLSCHIIVDNF